MMPAIMTRLAILADIHGNLPALEAVLADLATFRIDHIVVAGDVINWGPFSAAVVDRITSEGWPVIRGNNELYLLDYGTPRAPREWSDRTRFPILPWLVRQLAGRWQDVIAEWPETIRLEYPDAPPIRIYHGIPSTPWKGIFPTATGEEVGTYLEGVQESTIIVAHTHIAMDWQVGKWHILNPGTVGVPVDGIAPASYMILEGNVDGWRAHLRYVPFDIAPVLDAFRRQGFEDECGVVGHLIVREFETARLYLLPLLRWRDAHFPQEPLSMELLERFTEADRRAYLPLADGLVEQGVYKFGGSCSHAAPVS